jgi:hypothetical protein
MQQFNSVDQHIKLVELSKCAAMAKLVFLGLQLPTESGLAECLVQIPELAGITLELPEEEPLKPPSPPVEPVPEPVPETYPSIDVMSESTVKEVEVIEDQFRTVSEVDFFK